jgi:hypothetical protein
MNAQAKVLAGFDLDNLVAVAALTHRCGVKFDDEGEATMGFIMVGKNSPEYRQVQKEIRIENIQRAAKRKTQIDTATVEGATVVADTVEANDQRIATAVVVGWFGFTRGGKEVDFDKATAAGVLEAMPAWRDRVLADLEADANFMPSSSND